MSDANNIPGAQGPQAGGAVPEGNAIPGNQTGGQQNGVPEGVQARFNELTAEKHDLKDQVAAQQAQIAQLMELATANARAGAQAPAVPAVEIPPDQKAIMDAYMAPYLQQIQQSVNQTMGQLRPAVAQTQVHQVLQQRGESDPRVGPYAERMLQNWQANPGKFGTAWNVNDAIVFAKAAIAEEDQRSGRTVQNAQRQQMNANAGPLMGHHGAGTVPQVRPPTGEPPPLPANFDSLPYGQQAEILKNRIDEYGDGVVL